MRRAILAVWVLAFVACYQRSDDSAVGGTSAQTSEQATNNAESLSPLHVSLSLPDSRWYQCRVATGGVFTFVEAVRLSFDKAKVAVDTATARGCWEDPATLVWHLCSTSGWQADTARFVDSGELFTSVRLDAESELVIRDCGASVQFIVADDPLVMRGNPGVPNKWEIGGYRADPNTFGRGKFALSHAVYGR